MPKFFYVARDKTGIKITGTEESADPDELAGRIQARDLIVVNILSLSLEFKESEKAKKEEGFRLRHYRVTGEDLALFCRQLATLLGAGVPILKSLEVISKQVSSRKLYNVIKNLEKQMEAGLSLHEAMGKNRSIFSELWINLVESGEASGNLALVLGRLASYLERNTAFTKKVVSAMLYPIILLVAGTGALLFLTIRIIPTFMTLFKGFDITLPLLTRMLMEFSNFIRKYIPLMLGAMLVIFFIFKRYVATKYGRMRYEQFKFRLPLFGEFFRALVVERFSAELCTLLESGVPILYSLEITERSVNNLVVAGIINRIKEEVREGKSLTMPLERSEFFTPMVVQMVSIGEEIGELPNMFKRINAFYQEYVETFLVRFTTLFEPIMLVFMGVVIGIMVVGMFLPIFQIARWGGR